MQLLWKRRFQDAVTTNAAVHLISIIAFIMLTDAQNDSNSTTPAVEASNEIFLTQYDDTSTTERIIDKQNKLSTTDISSTPTPVFSSPTSPPTTIPTILLTSKNSENSDIIITTDVEQTATTADSSPQQCPDISLFNEDVDKLSTSQLAHISCICGPQGYSANNEVVFESINCIYGSTLTDLERNINFVLVENNRVIQKLTINGLQLNNDSSQSLMSILMPAGESPNFQLQVLEIRNCHGTKPLRISDMKNSTISINASLFQTLETLVIDNCELEEMPLEFLHNAPNLKYLSLVGNKIKFLAKSDLASSSTSLEVIKLEGNLITDIESEALSQLLVLKHLHIGEHNYASKTMLSDISRMPNLETLDLTRIDGLDGSNQPLESTSLKELILTGCNYKKINSSYFEKLDTLEVLDLRVNLIEEIGENSFANLSKLKRLNLAGNFLQGLRRAWNGLNSLKELDLSWNDFKILNSSTFETLTDGIEVLDLRHNEKLQKIESKTFDQQRFRNLRFFNISHSLLSEIGNDVLNMPNLKVLDLSYNNITSIKSEAFDGFKDKIEYLNISSNRLQSIDHELLNGTIQLKEIDISLNPWICNETMGRVQQEINKKYKTAARDSIDFELKNSHSTTCDRPYAKRGQPLFELEDMDFNYDKQWDTTLPPELTSTTTESYDNSTENSTVNLEQFTIFIGNEADNSPDSALNEDAGKPTYDINSIRYGQRNYKKWNNTWLSSLIVLVLMILTTVCVILVVRRKRSGITREPEFSKAVSSTTTQL